ncbi:MAG: hypothetical protein LBK76_09975 [Verrucomicrobiales bacterium]|jgi:hypothetical protein|nr:hypothetical protein [Verrucomicrobiales bacterium]
MTLEEKVDALQKSVDEIRHAIVGNGNYKTVGIVGQLEWQRQRLDKHSARLKRLEIFSYTIVGGAAVIGVIYAVVRDFFTQ